MQQSHRYLTGALLTALALAACSSAETFGPDGAILSPATPANSTTTGADLQISGSASTGSPNPGAAFFYTFQVKNSGPESAGGATFSDLLPAGTAFNFATVNGATTACSLLNAAVSCDLGTLASGGQATVVVNLDAPSLAGTFTNTGAASSTTTDPQLGNNAVTVTVQVKAPNVDAIKVTKCYTNATSTGGGEMLIKAASSDVTARLFAYRPDGSLIGELQNGGGSRYGGTVMPYQPYDPITVTIRSSSGGSITVPTTPFQP